MSLIFPFLGSELDSHYSRVFNENYNRFIFAIELSEFIISFNLLSKLKRE